MPIKYAGAEGGTRTHDTSFHFEIAVGVTSHNTLFI